MRNSVPRSKTDKCHLRLTSDLHVHTRAHTPTYKHAQHTAHQHKPTHISHHKCALIPLYTNIHTYPPHTHSSCSLPERSPVLDRWGHRTSSDQYVTDVSNIYHFWDKYKLQIFNLSALPAPSGTVIIHVGVEVVLPSSQETTYAYLFHCQLTMDELYKQEWNMCYLRHSYMRLLSVIPCYIMTAILIKVWDVWGFVVVLVGFWCFEAGFLCVALEVLELTL